MKTLALGLIAIFFAMNIASAQTPAHPATPPPAPAPVEAPTRQPRIADESHSELEGKSRSARYGKRVVLTVQPFGFGPLAITTQGVSAGFFVDHDSLVQVDLLGNSDEEYSDSHQLRVRSLGVSWKQFLGNSFYVRGGLEHRWVRESRADSWSYDATSTGMQFALGNQWQIKGFTIGCDWFGFNQSLTHSISDEEIVGSDSASSRADLDDEAEDSLEGMTFKALHFYLGFAF